MRNTAPTDARELEALETREWLESLDYVLQHGGPARVGRLLRELGIHAQKNGVKLPFTANTAYINTLHPSEEVPYPGSREIERRIKSLVRWNAMAMVVRANRIEDGIGGHISTYASSATLYEVAFNHFFRGRDRGDADSIFFQGHGSPGIYARAFLEGRISVEQLENFRRELRKGGGLSSYPHPWLMPEFWEFPTVSMGLGPIMAIYQARFNRYLEDRGLKPKTDAKVWAFLGDGETDFGIAGVAPGFPELFLGFLAGDRLVGRVDIGQTAHIASTLDVVLSAQRVDAAAGHAHVAEQHLQVGQAHDVAYAADVLGNAHGPYDGHRLTGSHDLSGFVKLVDRYAGDLGNPGGRVFHDGSFELVEVFGAFGDEIFGFHAFVEDDVHQPVEQGNVAARFLLEMERGKIAQVDAAGISDDQLRAAKTYRPAQHRPEDGMLLGGIGTNHKEGFCFLRDVVH